MDANVNQFKKNNQKKEVKNAFKTKKKDMLETLMLKAETKKKEDAIENYKKMVTREHIEHPNRGSVLIHANNSNDEMIAKESENKAAEENLKNISLEKEK